MLSMVQSSKSKLSEKSDAEIKFTLLRSKTESMKMIQGKNSEVLDKKKRGELS